MGINAKKKFGFKIVEPLVTLYKEQVRTVARYLGIPSEISERQPFPGPGLSVRLVGEIRVDKLDTLKKATAIIEHELLQCQSNQYFSVIIDNETMHLAEAINIQETIARFLAIPLSSVAVSIFKDKATGIKDGQRSYGNIVGVKVQSVNDIGSKKLAFNTLISLQAKIIAEYSTVSRVFYAIQDLDDEKPYVIGVRSVQTKDFLEAKISEIPWIKLDEIADKILNNCQNVSAVYYDITPKPPGTIEME
jgi:GMP synthase (glutamine-hydrolysing)